MIYRLALLIGVVAGSRALALTGTWLPFPGSILAVVILTVLAVADTPAGLVEDAGAIIGAWLVINAVPMAVLS
ncbi:MAG: hypothetical protein ACK4N1_09525 [Pseudorhizobium sp.]